MPSYTVLRVDADGKRYQRDIGADTEGDAIAQAILVPGGLWDENRDETTSDKTTFSIIGSTAITGVIGG
jgi:hypothetical protein